MGFHSTPGEGGDPDLGQLWLAFQTARILQRHVQFGSHRRIDLDALLSRAAVTTLASARHAAGARAWRATVEAVALCVSSDASVVDSRLDTEA